MDEEHRRSEEGKIFRSMGSCGAHEVVIESPDHSLPLALQSEEQICLLLRVLQGRYNDLMRDLRASQARRHVREEVPFYTGPRVEVAALVDSLP